MKQSSDFKVTGLLPLRYTLARKDGIFKIVPYSGIVSQGKRMPLKIKTICRHCERSEAIQFGFLTKHRSGLFHYVRNDGN